MASNLIPSMMWENVRLWLLELLNWSPVWCIKDNLDGDALTVWGFMYFDWFNLPVYRMCFKILFAEVKVWLSVCGNLVMPGSVTFWKLWCTNKSVNSHPCRLSFVGLSPSVGCLELMSDRSMDLWYLTRCMIRSVGSGVSRRGGCIWYLCGLPVWYMDFVML